MALRSAAQAAGGVAFLFYTSPVLTALMLAVVPGGGDGSGVLRAARAAARPRRSGRPGGGRRGGRGEHRRRAHGALVRRRGIREPALRRRPSAERSGWPGGASSPAPPSCPSPRSPATPPRCWCSGTAAGWWCGDEMHAGRADLVPDLHADRRLRPGRTGRAVGRLHARHRRRRAGVRADGPGARHPRPRRSDPGGPAGGQGRACAGALHLPHPPRRGRARRSRPHAGARPGGGAWSARRARASRPSPR